VDFGGSCLAILVQVFGNLEHIFFSIWSKFFSDFGASFSVISEQILRRFGASSSVISGVIRRFFFLGCS